MKIEIRKIKSGEKEYINCIVDWLWKEWGEKDNRNYWQSWVESSSNSDEIPLTFAAIISGSIVGTISLWRCDLQSKQDLFPWLGGLYIQNNHRHKGIATKLIQYACNEAQQLGYKELYLFTKLDGFFEKLQWEYMYDVPNEHGTLVKLFRKELQ